MLNLISLLDMTKLRGSDSAVGLVEEVTTFAPEMDVILGRPIPGISFEASVRTALPAGGAFRNANEGATRGKSQFQKKRFDCFFFDAPINVDEAVLIGGQVQGQSIGDIRAIEAGGVMRAKSISFGQQFYKTLGPDAKGFPGLGNFLDATMVTDAGGTLAADSYRAWFIWNHIQGVHFLWGANQGITTGEWRRQQITDPADPDKVLQADVNNLKGYVGIQSVHKFAVSCIKNITAGKPLTDALAYEHLAKLPITEVMMPTHCLVERQTRLGLQKSRSVTVFANLGGGKAGGSSNFAAPVPTDVAGVPLYCTDSILVEASDHA